MNAETYTQRNLNRIAEAQAASKAETDAYLARFDARNAETVEEVWGGEIVRVWTSKTEAQDLPMALVRYVVSEWDAAKALRMAGCQRDAIKVTSKLTKRVAPEGLEFGNFKHIHEWYYTR